MHPSQMFKKKSGITLGCLGSFNAKGHCVLKVCKEVVY